MYHSRVNTLVHEPQGIGRWSRPTTFAPSLDFNVSVLKPLEHYQVQQLRLQLGPPRRAKNIGSYVNSLYCIVKKKGENISECGRF